MASELDEKLKEALKETRALREQRQREDREKAANEAKKENE